MRLKLLKRSAHRRALVVGAVAAHTQWRGECKAVRTAYRRWVAASAAEQPFAFDDYTAALDREQRAASQYARRMRRAGRLPEMGLARQLAEIQISPPLP
jgi:hypothetical protein